MNTKHINAIPFLQDEYELSAKLIHRGFYELQNINYENDFYFLPLLLLSQGIERFLKAYLITCYIDKSTPEEDFYITDIQKGKMKTHDIPDLIKQINEITNYKININKPNLKAILKILSNFGHNGKYYNINYILEFHKLTSPIKEWERLESEINKLTGHKLIELENTLTRNTYYQEANKSIINELRLLLSDLSQYLVSDNETAKIIHFHGLEKFINPTEEEIDEKHNNITKAEGVKWDAKKRTFYKTIMSSILYKHKKIHKSQFSQQWPFKPDYIILEARNNKWFFIIIDNMKYALNGITAQHFKIPTLTKAGIATNPSLITDLINIIK